MSDERAAPVRHQSTPEFSVPPLADQGAGASFRTVLRLVRPIVGQAAVQAAGTSELLERLQLRTDPPTVSSCVPLESAGARTVPRTPHTEVVGFLDGIQRTRVVGHVHGSPLMYGVVAAVIRERVDRRLETWDTPRVQHTLFASRTHVGDDIWAQLSSSMPLMDVGDGDTSDLQLSHPLVTRTRALDIVAHKREAIERALAADWCTREQRWLWIDGGISGNLAIDEHATAFGVVKSHHTLYGDPPMMRTVLALREGERSPTFLIAHRSRRAVASWYLRLRETDGGDPLHGLVRVEVAPPLAVGDGTAVDRHVVERIASTSDRLSSWILAERRPLSLPDPRWDTLTYGVHACETFLKSIVGS